MSFATKAGIVLGAAAFSGMAVANTGNTSNDLQSRLEAAEAKIAEMSAQQNGDWLTNNAASRSVALSKMFSPTPTHAPAFRAPVLRPATRMDSSSSLPMANGR